jgi:isoquinoline 1-oxidoreductase beta subunit
MSQKTEQRANEWMLGDEGIGYHGISRRSFLLSGATIAFGVAFGGSLATVGKAFAQAKGTFAPNGWVHVAQDGTATIYSPASEMGQGVMTSIPLILAEEMDLDWNKVRVEQSPYNPKVFGNPRFGGGMNTGASRTTQGYYDVIRLAGLQARAVMLLAAAEQWGVSASELSTEPHTVVHKASGRRMGYGEIASFAKVPAQLPQVDKAQLKPMSQHRLIGKDVPRVDVPGKTTGQAEYGIDVRLPGMLYGTVLRTPVQGEKPAKVDDSEAKKIPGVVKIVTLPYGVGIIAQDYHSARKAKAALKVEWTNTAKARAYSSDKIISEYAARAGNLNDTSGVDFLAEGDAKGAMGKAAKTVSAVFTTEHVAHATMEPMNATARVNGDKIEIWAPSQSPFVIFLTATVGMGFKPENVTSHITLLGGGFGRRFEGDFVMDAALLAKAVDGTPVKVIWSREDDIQFDKYRPITAQHVSAGLDAQGKIIALRHRIVAESIYARAAPPVFQQSGGKDAPVCEGSETKYHVSNHLVEYLREQRGVDVGFWRAVGGGYTKFALETIVDECAQAAGKDPVEYRMALLDKEPRARKVLEEVAKMADWKKKRPAGRALGLAYSDMWNVHLAMITEVSVDRKTGNIRVHDVWAVVDPGVAVQPKNIEAQIESAVIFGVSSVLKEKITFRNGAVLQSNFHDYPLLRMNEAPLVHTKVIPTDNYPGGIGEIGLTTVAPCVANAVAALSGKRLRSLPFDTSQLKA